MGLNIQIAVDCRNPHELADWWAETLGWAVDYPDQDVVRDLIEQGRAVEADTEVHKGRIVWRGGAAICPLEELGAPSHTRRILFQPVPEEKSTKNRIHWDVALAGRNMDEARAELETRGATFLRTVSQGAHSWLTLADPEGNEFCLY